MVQLMKCFSWGQIHKNLTLDLSFMLSQIACKVDCTQERHLFVSTKHPHLPSS